MKLGFIGLGRMGAGMAANLVRAGHDVTVFNRSPGRAASLVALGAREAANLREACGGAVVITMLADDEAASDIALGHGGIIDHLPAGAIHLSMSTISVAVSKRLAQAHAQAGQRYAAAPVFGRPDMAASAKLFIVAAGQAATLDVCQPLFDALGQKTSRMGTEPSAANLVKLSGNFLLASAIEALGEAVALIGKAGIDPRAYVEFLTSTVFNIPAYKTYGDLIAGASSSPRGSPRLSDTRISVSHWPRPRVCAYPCRSEICCMTDLCACSPRAASISIGRPSVDWRPRTPGRPQRSHSVRNADQFTPSSPRHLSPESSTVSYDQSHTRRSK